VAWTVRYSCYDRALLPLNLQMPSLTMLTKITCDKISLITGKPTYESRLIINHVRSQPYDPVGGIAHLIQFKLYDGSQEYGHANMSIAHANDLLGALISLEHEIDLVSSSPSDYSEVRYFNEECDISFILFNLGGVDSTIATGIAISLGQSQSVKFHASRLTKIKQSVQTFLVDSGCAVSEGSS